MGKLYSERVDNGKRIEFSQRNDMEGKNYGVLERMTPWARKYETTRILVSPAIFSLLEGPERSSVYKTLQVKDGEQMNMLIHYISGEL